MKRINFFIAALAMVAAISCEKIIDNGYIKDEPYIEFHEEQMIVAVEGGEVIIPVTSTGIDHAFVAPNSNWIQNENGDRIPIDEWIKIVRIINDYDAKGEATRALAKWDSAIVVEVTPNETGYSRTATLSAQSFALSDKIIIRQSAE